MQSKGFTYVELLITIIVIGVLAALAIPAYQDYLRRAYMSEVVQVAAPYQVAVNECLQHTKKLKGCNAGARRIPAAIKAPNGPVSSLTVLDGIITVIPLPAKGVTTAETYILTPSYDASGDVTWKTSGGSVTKGYTQ